jgi:predicted RNase H-like HicB family nuclease
MANQNQPDPGVQSQGSKADEAMRKLKQQEELTRRAEKEQDEKIKKGGTNEITTKEGDSFIDGMPGYG